MNTKKPKVQPIPVDQPLSTGAWSTQFLIHFTLLAEHLTANDLRVLRLICHLLDEHGKELVVRNSNLTRMLGFEFNMATTRAFTHFKDLGLMPDHARFHNELDSRFAQPGGIPALMAAKKLA